MSRRRSGFRPDRRERRKARLERRAAKRAAKRGLPTVHLAESGPVPTPGMVTIVWACDAKPKPQVLAEAGICRACFSELVRLVEAEPGLELVG